VARLSIGELFTEAERLEQQGPLGPVLDLYKDWIAFNPVDPLLHAAYFNYSVVLSRAGDRTGAVNALREAMRIKPDFYPPHINLGRLLEDMGQSGSAVSQWLALVNSLSAVNGDAVRHKLIVLQQIGRVLENNHVDGAAEDSLRQAIDLRPQQPEVVQHWIALRQKQCKWPVIEGWEGMPRQALMANISPLSASVMIDDPLFQLGRAYRYAKDSIGIPDHPLPEANRRGPRPAKLRIGYVSSDLREHAVGFGLSEVMGLHDRGRYSIHAYYCGIGRDDPTRRRIRANVDGWTDINPMSDDEAARTIRADGIDILVDLNGYTRDARTAVFARRPAPIQANWYGFPGTMGTPYHHYVIGDAAVIPEGHEIYFTEKVLRLPCYQPNDRQRVVSETLPSRAAEGLPEGGFVFCNLNGSQKTTPAMFGHWMNILKAVPASVLWLLDATADTNARLRCLAEGQGVAPERLCFAPKRPNPEHLARYRFADLFLDTFPYGAHTTASDALWMGVPVLTMPGRSFASRVCAGLVQAAGAADLVCAGAEDYVARAIEIGREPAIARSLRQRIEANRSSAPLFDTPLLVRSLEGLYDTMWSDYATGQRPVPDLRNLGAYEKIGLALNCDEAAASGEATYHGRYRERLRHWNLTYPLPADDRLWTENTRQAARTLKSVPADKPAAPAESQRRRSRA
jgi:predicted O-linked N-acetylglucosamine transferase (SPINDLY family)